MNNVNIIGRLTRNPDVRQSNNGKTVCHMTVAVDTGYGEKKETAFIPVVVFGKSAENCEKYLSKGSQVGVTGRIQTGSYEKDGRKVYTTDVIATNVEFLAKSEAKAEKKTEAPTGFAQVDDDGYMPF